VDGGGRRGADDGTESLMVHFAIERAVVAPFPLTILVYSRLGRYPHVPPTRGWETSKGSPRWETDRAECNQPRDAFLVSFRGTENIVSRGESAGEGCIIPEKRGTQRDSILRSVSRDLIPVLVRTLVRWGGKADRWRLQRGIISVISRGGLPRD
jgi:hypothetical protein